MKAGFTSMGMNLTYCLCGTKYISEYSADQIYFSEVYDPLLPTTLTQMPVQTVYPNTTLAQTQDK